ncbi:MAG: hemolysin III family protein [Burkholderiaceae bacterium]
MHVDRPQTLGEEIANAISHGIGFLLAVASLPILLMSDTVRGAMSITAVSVFSATMMVLYLASAVYHALPQGTLKRAFQRLDHASIFLFIAGSYMPFVLGPLRGPWGWSLFGVVWAMAVTGMLAKGLDRLKHPWISTGLYVAMGWVALVAIVPMVQRIEAGGLALLVGGGVSYTLGALFFLLDNRVRYAHFVWHLFVMGGSFCHFLAALWYAPTVIA